MKRIRKTIVLICIHTILWTVLGSTVAFEYNGLDNFDESKRIAPVFNDVIEDDWCFGYVREVSSKGLMVGKNATTFDPNGNVTLAQTITIAARMHSIYYTGAEDFRQGAVWYQVYLDYANAVGITSLNVSDYNRQATRAEFAQIIASAFPEEALAPINILSNSAIPDVTMQMPCGEAVYALYRAGVLAGKNTAGVFAPYSNISRGEVAAIICRMIDPDSRMILNLQGGDEVPEVVEDAGRRPTRDPDLEGMEPIEQKQPEEPADTATPVFHVQTVNAKAGQQEVAVEICVKNNPGISALALRLSYDDEIELDHITYNDQLVGQTLLPQVMKNPVKLIWVSPFADVTSDFVLATAYFDVSETVQKGEYAVSVTYDPDDVYELSEENVYFDVVQGKILIG